MAKASLKSPKGIASYPHLNKADFKFDEDGVWKTDLIVDKTAETEAFCDAIKGVASAAFGKKASEAHLPFFDHKEDDTKMVLRFSTKYEPALHSASGAKVSRNGLPMIGTGSTLKISTAAESWEGKGKGVKLYLNAVQIIDLVEYGAADFENEEGGWEPEVWRCRLRERRGRLGA
jgi:hypothetical protein